MAQNGTQTDLLSQIQVGKLVIVSFFFCSRDAHSCVVVHGKQDLLATFEHVYRYTAVTKLPFLI